MPRNVWPPHRSLQPLVHAHYGLPGIVMGGGHSITEGMAAAPRNGIYVSANDHGLRWLADHPKDGRRCSYGVCADKIELRMRHDVRPGKGDPWGVPLIARHMWGDYRMLHMPGRLTGQAAAWCLRVMGCSPIILIGMDLYDGATYFDDPKAHSTGRSSPPTHHLKHWHDFVGRYPGMYRVIGCNKILRQRLGVYDPAEPVAKPVAREKLLQEIEARTVRLIRQAEIRMRIFPAGEVLDVGIAEAEQLRKERKAVPVNRV